MPAAERMSRIVLESIPLFLQSIAPKIRALNAATLLVSFKELASLSLPCA